MILRKQLRAQAQKMYNILQTMINKIAFLTTALVAILMPSVLMAETRPGDDVYAQRRKYMVEKQIAIHHYLLI